MTESRTERDEVLEVDRYLEALLAMGDEARDAAAMSGLDPDARGIVGRTLDPVLRSTALRLRRDLVRVHPSFRFEERLSRRLADAGVARRRVAAGAEGTLIPFRMRPADPEAAEDRLLAAIAAGSVDPAAAPPAIDPAAIARSATARPVLLGGAITSAALSLAGVAWVAWRARERNARGRSAMRRAARAARNRARTGRDARPWHPGLS